MKISVVKMLMLISIQPCFWLKMLLVSGVEKLCERLLNIFKFKRIYLRQFKVLDFFLTKIVIRFLINFDY